MNIATFAALERQFCHFYRLALPRPSPGYFFALTPRNGVGASLSKKPDAHLRRVGLPCNLMKSFVARTGVEPVSSGYEPDELPAFPPRSVIGPLSSGPMSYFLKKVLTLHRLFCPSYMSRCYQRGLSLFKKGTGIGKTCPRRFSRTSLF